MYEQKVSRFNLRDDMYAPTMDVIINNTEECTALVDTGASISVWNEGLDEFNEIFNDYIIDTCYYVLGGFGVDRKICEVKILSQLSISQDDNEPLVLKNIPIIIDETKTLKNIRLILPWTAFEKTLLVINTNGSNRRVLSVTPTTERLFENTFYNNRLTGATFEELQRACESKGFSDRVHRKIINIAFNQDVDKVGKFLKKTRLHVDSTNTTTEPTAQQVLYMESLIKEMLGCDLNQQSQGIDFVYSEATPTPNNATQPFPQSVEPDLKQQIVLLQQEVESLKQENQNLVDKYNELEEDYQNLNNEHEELLQETEICTDSNSDNIDDDIDNLDTLSF